MTSAPFRVNLRIRRMGWLAVLGICLLMYAMLHLKVTAMHADVVRAEQRIVALEEQKLLLETEFLTRANQVQLAAWNRVDFGFKSPEADQFIENTRQLASYGAPPMQGAPTPIRLAGMESAEGVPEFPQLVSPLTGRKIEANLLDEEPRDDDRLAVTMAPGPIRSPIVGVSGVLAEASIR